MHCMDDGRDRTLRYLVPRGDGMLVQRLLSRDGFEFVGSETRPSGTRVELSVLAETAGREARVREVMARWAPGATLLHRG